jgi:hypothetical protein
VYLQAKTFSARPSAILGVGNANLAYMFDDAVLSFGLYIDEMRKQTTKDGKRYLYTLEELLRDKDDAPVKRIDNAKAAQKLMQMAGTKVVE